MKIYIYNDFGVNPESLRHTINFIQEYFSQYFEIATIDAKNIIETEWEKNTRLLVIPGGADLPYKRKITKIAIKKIQDYIKDGGLYLGICAGAYFASNKVEFDIGGPLEVKGPRDLKLFPGTATGPIIAPFDYRSDSGARAALIKVDNKMIKIYYNGGPYFSFEKNNKTTVLAYYDYNDKLLPAIILSKYGKGRALLSGVHFEYNANILNDKNIFMQQIKPELLPYESQRQELCTSLIEHLGIKDELANISNIS